MKQFDANGTDVDAYPERAFRGGVYDGGVMGIPRKKPEVIVERVPDFAKDYPERAETLEQARLPFYCCNCYRKGPTRWLTPNFGPFCASCLRELVTNG